MQDTVASGPGSNGFSGAMEQITSAWNAGTRRGASGSKARWSVRDGVPILIREECDQLFYIYTGARHGLLGNPLPFLDRTRLLERNLAFFSDPHVAYYYRGVSAPLDSYDTFLAWQRTLPKQLPHVKRLFCLGTSMGAYAALSFGHLLAAEEVWAFAPATKLDAQDHPYVPPDRRDLRELLRNSSGKSRYNVYYNRSSSDRDAALRLIDCENVALWPQNGDGHNVVQTLTAQGRLATLLPPLTSV
jgi:hypothetical protein